jgi:hypothetical protein
MGPELRGFRRGVVGMGPEPRIGGAVDGAGEQSQRPTTREALVLATEAEIDRRCAEWIGLVVGATRAGLRPAPAGGIGDYLKRRRMRRAPASRRVTKRGQAPFDSAQDKAALHRGFVDLAHIAP